MEELTVENYSNPRLKRYEPTEEYGYYVMEESPFGDHVEYSVYVEDVVSLSNRLTEATANTLRDAFEKELLIGRHNIDVMLLKTDILELLDTIKMIKKDLELLQECGDLGNYNIEDDRMWRKAKYIVDKFAFFKID